MSESIAINKRAADNIRALIEQSQRAQDTLRTFVEAVGAQLDIPSGWRFDTQTMSFVPPANEATDTSGNEQYPA